MSSVGSDELGLRKLQEYHKKLQEEDLKQRKESHTHKNLVFLRSEWEKRGLRLALVPIELSKSSELADFMVEASSGIAHELLAEAMVPSERVLASLVTATENKHTYERLLVKIIRKLLDWKIREYMSARDREYTSIRVRRYDERTVDRALTFLRSIGYEVDSHDWNYISIKKPTTSGGAGLEVYYAS